MSDFLRGLGASAPVEQEQPQAPRVAPRPAAKPVDPGYTSIWDRIWTDDFSKVPVVGPVASTTASAISKGYDEYFGALAWGVSVLPGGIDTMDWESRKKVSFGQAVVANAGALQNQGPLGVTANLVTGMLPAVGALKTFDSDNPALKQGFDVEDDAQRKAAFDDGLGRVLSGTTDLAAQFFLDPLVIVGKGIKVARFGGQAAEALSRGSFLGLTNRQLASTRVLQKVADEADTAMTLSSGKGDNVIGILADQVVKGDFEDLRSLPQFNNANRDILASIGSKITDRNEAITFLAAASGSRKHIAMFRDQYASGYDALRTAARGGTQSELLQLTKPAGEFDKGLFKDVPEADISAKAILDDAAKRDPQLADALGWIAPGERLIDDIGYADNAFGRAMARRAGNKRMAKWDSKPGTVSPLDERIFNTEAGGRPVRVWEWTRGVKEFVTGERGSGFMDVRGPNIGKASDDLRATLTDSRTLRRDQGFITEMLNLYGEKALYSMDRVQIVKEIEQRAMLRLAEQYKVSEEAAKSIYAQLDRKRMDTIERLQNGFGVDEAGELIASGPQLRSQLETKLPMLDMRLMEESFRIAQRQMMNGTLDLKSKGWETMEATRNFFDQINSIWKASVLIRLGYTQRNVVEGWLRSAAALGTIPSLAHPITGAANFGANMSRRVRFRTLKASAEQSRALSVKAAQAREAGDIAGAQVLEAQVMDLDAKIQNLVQRRHGKDTEFTFDIELPNGETVKKSYSAFGGPMGQVRKDLSSAAGTTALTLESKWGREAAAAAVTRSYAKINPGKAQYFDELAQATRQFQGDAVAQMYMRGATRGEVIDWIRSDAATFYRNDMKIPAGAYEAHVRKVTSMVDRYLPDEALRTELAGAQSVSADVLRARLGGRTDLSPIHGREVEAAILPPARQLGQMAQGRINWLFDVLGNKPETALVRHPFYAEVWQRKFSELTRQAREQGMTLDAATLERINQNANRTALRAVNETLYTIERYSNIAHMVRFIAPFYPAWENSIKVWARLVGRDPSIIGRANVLWNIPAELGMVVDKDGNKVEGTAFDFLTGSQDRFIVLPDGMQKVFQKFSGGVPFKIPQGSLNVVAPGDTPYLPGGGPMVTYSAAQVLASRPDWQAWIKQNIGEAAFRQIAPFGEVDPTLMANFAPSAAKQIKALVSGEEDELFVQTMATMTQSAYVDWYKSGMNPAEKPDYNDIVEQARQFHLFRLGAALTLPFSLTRMSKYQVEMDAWNQLKADPNLTFGQKVERFIGKYGDAFMPVTTSTSKYEAGIEPTLDSYKILSGNADLARELATLDPEAVGIIAAAAPPGEFDIGVYNWLGQEKVPGTNDTYRSRRGGAEMQNAITLQAAYREYNKAKEARDAAMQQLGLKSLNSNAAAGIKAQWDWFSKSYLAEKYGEVWTANGPQNYEAKQARWITAINMAMSNQQFMSQHAETPLWQGLTVYMNARNSAVQAIMAGADPTGVKAAFEEWSGNHKYSSLEFSDFWDKFLENDDLTLGIGGQ